MNGSLDFTWQPSLFEAEAPSFDRSFAGIRRVALDPTAWVDHAPGWVTGADKLFGEVLESRDWGQRARRMFDKRVLEPRLTSPWNAGSGEPLEPILIEQMRVALSERYEVDFDSVGFNLYRDGRDSVAWHGDRIKKDIEEPIVALLSLGDTRRFLLRPKGGGLRRHSCWPPATCW